MLAQSKVLLIRMAKKKAFAAKNSVKNAIDSIKKAKHALLRAKIAVLKSQQELKKAKTNAVNPDVLLKEAQKQIQRAKQLMKRSLYQSKQAHYIVRQANELAQDTIRLLAKAKSDMSRSRHELKYMLHATVRANKYLVSIKKQLYKQRVRLAQLKHKEHHELIQHKQQLNNMKKIQQKLLESLLKAKAHMKKTLRNYQLAKRTYALSKSVHGKLKQHNHTSTLVLKHMTAMSNHTKQIVSKIRKEVRNESSQLVKLTQPKCTLCSNVVDTMMDIMEEENMSCKNSTKSLCEEGYDSHENLQKRACYFIMANHCPIIEKQRHYLYIHPLSVCKSIQIC